MPIITGGNVVRNTTQAEGTVTRRYASNGAPVAGTTYAGIIVPGELVEDVTTGDVYEYTEPAAVPTFTKIDAA